MTFKRHRKLLGPTGLDIPIDENKLYLRDTDGNLVEWNGLSNVNSDDLILKGSERYSRKAVTETTDQDMIVDRNLTSLANRINNLYSLDGFIQGGWAAPGVEGAEVISTSLQLKDINNANFTSSQRVNIKLTSSATNINAVAPAGLTITSTTGTTVTPTTYTGTGLNDLTVTGTFTGVNILNFVVEIESATTFKWSIDGGVTFPNTGVLIAVSSTLLQDGISVTFGAVPGHTIGDKWVFTFKSNEIIVDSDASGVIVIATTDSSAGSLTGFLHLLKATTDLKNNMILKATSAAITFVA